MRFSAAILAMAVLLAACVSRQPDPVAEVNPITGPEIAASVLPPAPAAGAVAAPTPKPIAPPVPEPVAEPVAEPAPLLSPAEIDCVRDRGRWAQVGRSGAHTCVYTTKDGGKSCSRESDCEGVCLARSKTCSPLRPLFGCNDILQDNGAMATLCID